MDKDIIKNENFLGQSIFWIYSKIRSLIFHRLIPEKIITRLKFKKIFRFNLNLKNPKTLNEKLQWKKIYDRKKIYTLCADKYKVREIVKKKIGKKYLIPLMFCTNNPNEIPFDNLSLPFIIKGNNGSGQDIIIRRKEEINKTQIIKECNKWLKFNYYILSKEWQYKNIPPKILIEKLLLTNEGKVPMDCKFHCFNGKVEFIQVNTDKFEDHKMSFFDTNWNLLPFTWCPTKDGKPIWKINKEIRKPKNLNEMIKISKKLSKDFDYIRVDLYSLNNKIYFGELTFHPGAGFNIFFPLKYDKIFGDKLKIKNEKL